MDAICGAVTGLTHAMEMIGEHAVYHVEIEVDAAKDLADPDRFDRPLR